MGVDVACVRPFPRPAMTLPLMLVALAWGVFAFHWFWLTGLVLLSSAFVAMWIRSRRAAPAARWVRTGRLARGVTALVAFAMCMSWLVLVTMLPSFAPAVRDDVDCRQAPRQGPGIDHRGRCHRAGGAGECGQGATIKLLLLADLPHPQYYRRCTFVLGF